MTISSQATDLALDALYASPSWRKDPQADKQRDRMSNALTAALPHLAPKPTESDEQRAAQATQIAALRRENKIAMSALTAIRPYIEREAKMEKSPWAIVGMMHVDAALSASAPSAALEMSGGAK